MQQRDVEHGDEQDRGADSGKGEAEKLDEESAEIELPAEHRGRPAVISDVAGGGEDAGAPDVGPVIVQAHLEDGV